jgi:hypothetical protein
MRQGIENFTFKIVSIAGMKKLKMTGIDIIKDNEEDVRRSIIIEEFKRSSIGQPIAVDKDGKEYVCYQQSFGEDQLEAIIDAGKIVPTMTTKIQIYFIKRLTPTS